MATAENSITVGSPPYPDGCGASDPDPSRTTSNLTDGALANGIAIHKVVFDEVSVLSHGGGNTTGPDETITSNTGSLGRWYKLAIVISVGLIFVSIIVALAFIIATTSTSEEDSVQEQDGVGATLDDFVNVLPNYTQVALEDPNSAQSLALEWLWKDPAYATSLPNFRRLQRFALATIFYTAHLAGSHSVDEDFIAYGNWLSDVHECEWFTNDVAATRCQDEKYISFDLSGLQVFMSFAPEVGLLTTLQLVDFTDNDLFGSIPTQFGLLTDLRHLKLASNAIIGTMPIELGSLNHLRELELQQNNITGTIPSELMGLGALTSLEVDSNHLSGSLPTEVGELSQLEFLSLHNNSIVGTLPTGLGRLQKLLYLRINANDDLFGTIPTEVGEFLDIRELHLEDTNLNGTMPQQVCDLWSMGRLELIQVSCEKVRCDCNCTCSLSR